MAPKPSSPATKADLEKVKNEILRYFDLKTEQLLVDYRNLFVDRTAQHRQRIDELERRIDRAESKLGLTT